MSGDGLAETEEKSYPHQVAIDAYGEMGFRFADMSHRGSLLCLPSGMRAWNVKQVEELSLELFQPVLDEADKIDVLFIGMGADFLHLKADIRQALKKSGISVEAVSTGNAISTYNILLGEKRAVAAALISVTHTLDN